MVRVLASIQCGLGFILARCCMWVEFAVSSCLALGMLPGFFCPGSLVFLPPEKPTNVSRVQFDHDENQLKLMWLLL